MVFPLQDICHPRAHLRHGDRLADPPRVPGALVLHPHCLQRPLPCPHRNHHCSVCVPRCFLQERSQPIRALPDLLWLDRDRGRLQILAAHTCAEGLHADARLSYDRGSPDQRRRDSPRLCRPLCLLLCSHVLLRSHVTLHVGLRDRRHDSFQLQQLLPGDAHPLSGLYWRLVVRGALRLNVGKARHLWAGLWGPLCARLAHHGQPRHGEPLCRVHHRKL
mmetsp:Transcript_58834/g.141877  ORF Transcript_58834/g.141877 Transcript_58834/m.141877 type:complete len:219 (-) Transcript_58834:387-1043(-)